VKNKELNFKQADAIIHSIFFKNRASYKNISEEETYFLSY
jgi:hypothetical protein